MEENLDKILNDDESKKNTKSRLESLKEILKADSVQFNATEILADPNDFPHSNRFESRNTDYSVKDQENKSIATSVISNIIITYIKSDEILESPRVKDLRNNQIDEYADMLLLRQITKSNLVKLQENIDIGDMSKEMYDSVNAAQKELRANIDHINEFLKYIEKYWKDYSANFGMTNDEEKIILDTKKSDKEEAKTFIVDPIKLIEIIQENLTKEQEKMKKKAEE